MTAEMQRGQSVTLAVRLRSAFWYWDSLLANLSSAYDQGILNGGPAARVFLPGYLRQTRQTEKRLLSDWDREGWLPEVEQVFRKEQTAYARMACELFDVGRPTYRRNVQEFLRDLWDYLNRSDCISLYLVELLSNERNGRAPQAMLDFVNRSFEELCEVYEEPESGAAETDEVPLCRCAEWERYGSFMLTVAALVKAMTIDRIARSLAPNSELATMILHTMEEYRQIGQVAERTYDIYLLHFTKETGGKLTRNEYLVLLTWFLLRGNDHLYGAYADAIRVFTDRYKALLLLHNDNADAFLNHVMDEIVANQATLDLSHPQAPRFFLRAIGRVMAPALTSEELMDYAFSEDKRSAGFADELRAAKLGTERERFVEGDFSSEHLYNQNQEAYRNISSGAEFEQYLNYIFTRLGYESRMTKATGDQGADLILKKNGIVYVVQAKFYDRPVGNKAVQEAVAALPYYEGNRSVVVTNSTYTNSARNLAKKNHVLLVDGKQLEDLVRLAYSDQAAGSML